MDAVGVHARIAALIDADLAVCDRVRLAILVRDVNRVRAWLDACEAQIGARAAELGEPVVALLDDGGRRSDRDARAAARRAQISSKLPAFTDALGNGRVSAGHLDAIVDAHRKLDDTGKVALIASEDVLLKAAVDSSVGEFTPEVQALARTLADDEGRSRHERLREQRNVRRSVDRDTGMHKTILTLDPETDAKVWTSIHAAIGQERSKRQDPDTNWDHVVTDAVVRLITEPHTGGETKVPEVIVLIDLDTMRTGVHDDTVSETSEGVELPPDVIRRMACEGDIIPAVLGEKRQVVDLGRARRLATKHQRNALRAMYRTCAFPGCTVPFDHCRVHHVDVWERGGRSDLDRLVPLCTEHHHAVHEGGWKLELDADRTIRVYRPDGTLHFEGSTVDRSKSA